MDKDRVAEVLAEIGTLLELKGENPSRTRAYKNAARTLESLTEPLEKLIAENRLSEINGIGEGIQKKITELVTTGKLAYYDGLKASIPPGLVEMLQIPGLGPKGQSAERKARYRNDRPTRSRLPSGQGRHTGRLRRKNPEQNSRRHRIQTRL